MLVLRYLGHDILGLDSPSQEGIPEKAKVASAAPTPPPRVTGFPEAVVLALRARLHRRAQVPVGARHCGLGRRKGRATMERGDGLADSRRGAEGGGGEWNFEPEGWNAAAERAGAAGIRP